MTSSHPHPHSLRPPRLLRLIGTAVAVALIGVGLIACSTTAATPTSTGSDTRPIRVGISGGSTGTTLDPHVVVDAYGAWFAGVFYETIGSVDEDNTYHDVLAESFTPNDDATSWTLVLKDGITFHSGKPLTADDVIFTFNRILDPATAATAASSVSTIDRMTQLDERTVRFDLTAPRPAFSHNISSSSALGIIPTDFDVAAPDSTGPWTFDSYDPGVETVLSRYDGYHDTPAKVDGLRIVALPDNNARFNALTSGQIDVDSAVTPSNLPQIENDPSFSVLDLPASGFQVITMRVDRGPTADPRVREALRLAVDRQQIVTVVDGGHARIAYDLYGIDDPLYRHDLVREHDVDRATELIREAGATGAHLTLYTTAGIAPMAQIVAQNARAIGLDVTVEVRDPATYVSGGYLDYDFAVDQWPAYSILDIAGLTDGPHPSLPYTRFHDPEFDEAYEVAVTTTDVDARREAVGRIQEILFDRGGFIIPRFTNVLVASASTLTGWPSADPAGGLGVQRALRTVSWTQ